MKKVYLGLFIALFSGLTLQAVPGIFVDKEGKRYSGDVTALASGDVTFKDANGNQRRYSKGQYRYVKYLPMPKELEKYKKDFENNRIDAVIGAAPSLAQKFKYAGYGEFVAYYEAMSVINKAKESAKVKKEEFVLEKNGRLLRQLDDILQRGLEVRNDNNEYYYLCLGMHLKIMMAMPEKQDTLNDKFAILLQTKDLMELYTVLSARGEYYQQTGDTIRSVTEYTKILLYIPADEKKMGQQREAAKRKIKEILGPNSPHVGVLSAL